MADTCGQLYENEKETARRLFLVGMSIPGASWTAEQADKAMKEIVIPMAVAIEASLKQTVPV